MTTEGGARLDEMADFLGTDEKTGIQVAADGGEVRIIIDSTSYPNEHIDMDPADIDALCALLQEKKREALR